MSRSELWHRLRETGKIQYTRHCLSVLWMTVCLERFVAAEFVVLRSVVMAEAGFMGTGDWGKMWQHWGKMRLLLKNYLLLFPLSFVTGCMPGAMMGSTSILWAKKRIDEKRETCAAVSDEAEVLILEQSVVLQQIGIPYCLEFTPRLLHSWS